MKKRCIIIPAFNEEENIISVINDIKKYSDADIVVIDDGSKDLTSKKSKDAGAFVINHPYNMGYGVALQTGYKYAVKKGYDFLIQMDGDGQHDPKFISELFDEVESGNCDVIIGSRFLGDDNYNPGILKSTGIRLFNSIIRITCKKCVTDPTSGYQSLNKEVVSFFTHDSFPCDYPDANIIVMLQRVGFRVREIPVIMNPSPMGRGMHRGFATIGYYLFKMFLSIFIALIRERSFYQ